MENTENTTLTGNLLFILGALVLVLAIFSPAKNGSAFYLSTLSLILFIISYTMHDRGARALLPVAYSSVEIPFEAPPLKDKTVVKFTVHLYCPVTAREDDIRFTIPKSIRDRAFQYLSGLDTFSDPIEFEEILVKYARHLSNQLNIPPIKLTVTAFPHKPSSFNSGVIIGHTK